MFIYLFCQSKLKRMTPGIKNYFSCFRRELSDLVISEKKRNKKNLKEREKQFVRNDFQRYEKNSNSYRDYSRFATSCPATENNETKNLNSKNLLNCEKKLINLNGDLLNEEKVEEEEDVNGIKKRKTF